MEPNKHVYRNIDNDFYVYNDANMDANEYTYMDIHIYAD